MELTMLGTGNALVTECYNTCFVLHEDSRCILVDGGGGNAILHQLKAAGFALQNIHTVFVTHKHIDHLLGIVWVMRMLCQSMLRGEYEGDATIYAHAEVTTLLQELAEKLLFAKEVQFLGTRLHLVAVADGETRVLEGHAVTFFDIQSTKALQFGFCMQLADGQKLTCCGDEPYNLCEESYAKGSKWLLHEAFCLATQADVFHPYEKHHSTVKDACEAAKQLGVQNLVLYHTEDRNLPHRKQLYTAEGRQYFHGNLFVPEDLETISL